MKNNLDATLHQLIFTHSCSRPQTGNTTILLSLGSCPCNAVVTPDKHLRRPFLPPAMPPASHTPAAAKRDDVLLKRCQEVLEYMCLGVQGLFDCLRMGGCLVSGALPRSEWSGGGVDHAGYTDLVHGKEEAERTETCV